MNQHEDNDYVWHFKLRDDEPAAGSADALTAMVTEQVVALLKCVSLMCDGADVDVTGFRLLEEGSPEHLLPSRLDDGEGRGEARRPSPPCFFTPTILSP